MGCALSGPALSKDLKSQRSRKLFCMEHHTRPHPRDVTCPPQLVGFLHADMDHECSNTHHFLLEQGRLLHCCALDPSPSLCVRTSKKRKVTRKGKKQEDEQRGRTRWTFKLTMLTKLDTYLKRDQSILLLCTNINLNLL